jgi:DNA-binding transcriptional regulator YdaS (Cro superfamily)
MKQTVEIFTDRRTLMITDRLPIFEATRSLGMTDRKIAKLMGISTEAVCQFVNGKRPLPHVRYLALLYLITRLTGVVGAAYPPQSRFARRAAVPCESAKRWAELAKDVECAPEAGQIQAAVLTICRAWLSSNWAGLR